MAVSGGRHIFHIADARQIKAGEITDVYFTRVRQVLEAGGIDKRVVAEVRAAALPEDWSWAVLAGIEEVVELFRDVPVDVESLPEGSLFYPEEPVLAVSGRYLEFAVFETALLGLLCEASGVATRAARCTMAAQGRPVYSFGARRMHPAVAPMIERNAYVGGCTGVAVTASGRLIGEEPVGTMPHALILTVGSDTEAWRLFDQVIPAEVRRVALIDTFEDEKFAALKAAETLGDHLFAVRLDTPHSRRGDFGRICREVRWELDQRGRNDVKIFLSGGLNEKTLLGLNDYADAYGVGTAISNAPVVDFAMDIVEVEGEPFAKRGKLSGTKQVLGCKTCGWRQTVPKSRLRGEAGGELLAACPRCDGPLRPLIADRVRGGQVVTATERPADIRRFVLEQVDGLRPFWEAT